MKSRMKIHTMWSQKNKKGKNKKTVMLWLHWWKLSFPQDRPNLVVAKMVVAKKLVAKEKGKRMVNPV